jgi:ABC-2 type transport system ATP-binding protein
LKAEFGKDLVELTLKARDGGSSEEQVKSRLSDLQLGSDLTVHDRAVRVAVANGKTALPSIIHKIESIGIEVESISVRSPSLDDVFIKYTGRGIREEEGSDDSSDTRKYTAKIIGKMRSRV